VIRRFLIVETLDFLSFCLLPSALCPVPSAFCYKKLIYRIFIKNSNPTGFFKTSVKVLIDLMLH
jgi:hypothetical protein